MNEMELVSLKNELINEVEAVSSNLPMLVYVTGLLW